MAKRFGKIDGAFLGTLLFLLVAGYAFFSLSGKEDGSFVKITIDGQLYGTYPLDKEKTVKIVIGETVTNVLQIQGGTAKMISANCPDKLCMHQRAIENQRETIVCLPNKVVAEVIGGGAANVDTVARKDGL